MAAHNRRQFLQRAVAAGAGAAVLPALASPGAARAASTSGGSDDDPGFVGGRVASVSGSSLSVIDPGGARHHLTLDSGSRIWKEGTVNGANIAVGDHLDARGALDGGDVLQVERAWANIENLRGRVVTPGGRSFTLALERSHGRQQQVAVAGNAAINAPNGSRQQGTASSLGQGADLIAIGYSDPRSGLITVTAVFASLINPSPFSTEPPAGETIEPDAYTRHRGVASFFDCPPSACGTCSSSKLQCAWPKLKDGCGPFNGNCKLKSSFERHSCGTYIPVKNPCNGHTVTVRIADCGPTIRCVSPVACKSYTKVFLDLTRAAFSRIANLDKGLIDVKTGDAY